MGSSFAVMFAYDATLSAAPVASVSFTLPPGAPTPSKVVVTGLVPGAAYTMTTPGGAGSYLIAQGGSASIADASGVVVF